MGWYVVTNKPVGVGRCFFLSLSLPFPERSTPSSLIAGGTLLPPVAWHLDELVCHGYSHLLHAWILSWSVAVSVVGVSFCKSADELLCDVHYKLGVSNLDRVVVIFTLCHGPLYNR